MSRICLFIPLILWAIGLKAQVTRTPWQIHDAGYTVAEQNIIINNATHGDSSMYQYAVIPAINDPLWAMAPLNSSGNIHFSQPSRLPSNECLQRVDFTYFQTILDIPAGITITDCTVGFAAADDGVRVYVFNATHITPAQAYLPGSEIVFGQPPLTTNIASMLVPGLNRIVFVQGDDCAVDNNMTDGSIRINGAVINSISATALNFDGINDFVNIGNPSNLRLRNQLTLETWFKTSAAVNNESLISKWNTDGSAGNAAYALSWKGGSLGLSLQSSNMNFIRCESGMALNDDEWHHVAATWDGAAAKIYIDGVLKNTVTNALFDSVENNLLDVRIGTDASGNNDRFFKGNMDETRIWGRALCIGEIQNNMWCGLNATGQTDLRALYHFNQGIVNGDNTAFDTVIDAGSYLSTGTMMNFARTGSTSNWTFGKATGNCNAFSITSTITKNGATTFCEGGSVILTAESGDGYLWSNGANTQSIIVTQSGVYSVTVLQLNGCSRIAPGITVTVHPTPVINSATIGIICSNAPQNYIISGTVAGTTFVWTRDAVTGIIQPAESGSGDAITEPLTNTTNTPTTVIYSIVPTANGCTGNSFLYSLLVNPTPVVNSGSSGITCSGIADSYTITGSVAGSTFEWSRDAVTGITNAAVTNETANPVVETLVNTTTAPVNVNYMIIPTANGCAGAGFTYTKTVKPSPVINSITNNGPLCIGTTLNLAVSATTGVSYNWTGPHGFTSILANPVVPSVTTADSGIYTLNVTLDGCTGQPMSNLVIVSSKLSTVNAGTNKTICNNDSIALTGIVTGFSSTGTWSTSGSGHFNPSNDVLNAVYVPGATDITAGNVFLTLQSTNNGTCTPASQTIKVTLVAPPASYSGVDQTICSYDKVVLNGSGANLTSVTWSSSGTGYFSPSAHAFHVTYTPGAADIKQGKLQLMMSSFGNATCKPATDTTNIVIVAAPVVNAGEDKTILQGQVVILQSAVTGTVKDYLWTPGTWLIDNTQPAATVTPLDDITYTVTVTDAQGCKASDSVKVNVLFPLIIPNAFSPNGDGINDKWNIDNLSKYPGCTVEIFTRYGQLIYYSKGYNISWDGLYYGQVMPTGTYYYIINTNQGLPVYKGWVQLMR